MWSSRFPQELIDMIIDDIGMDDVTLHSCALVCRPFLQASKARIFCKIDISSTQSTVSGSCQRLHRIFRNSPHLCPYVRRLCIVEDSSIPTSFPGAWISSLISVLSMLNALTSFTFEARNRDVGWMKMPQELRSAICRLCERPSLVKLRLLCLGRFTELDEFASLIASPNLADIVVWNMQLPRAAEATQVARTMLKPVSCCLALVGPTADTLMRWLAEGDLSNLQHLSIVWSPQNTAHLQRVVNGSAASLARLKLIMIRTPSLYVSQNLVLPHSTTFRCVKLYLNLSASDAVTIPTWISEIFQPPQRPSFLINIAVKIGGIGTINPLLHSMTPLDWAPLLSVLSVAQFPMLRTLRVYSRHHSARSGL
ncbi:hypothetical protein FB451DRAFT_1409562 [Mycena latifolia]|nr:hypothetical protein FB451DRAFT_1409562 [Mycena latifolia]